ncbi:family 43 glycosylhydrolase [Kribbella sp. CA-294648]|uniref:family 43 glycosylhydrolase n=1 Tax=Kribbella sp. CA-294648 TaxID=3239948 RepID=UPI003D8F6380
MLSAVVALLAAALSAPVPAQAAAPYNHIANDTVWEDSSGNEIKAQGGNVFKFGSTYYWVGASLEPLSEDPHRSINLYSSPDLENWTFVKVLLTQSGSTGDLAVGNWLGRPQLGRNPTTGQFVLAVGVAVQSPELGNKLGFATSSTIDGTYTYHGSSIVNGYTIGDHSMFVEGPNAYLVYVAYTATTAKTISVAPLGSNWLSVGPAISAIADTTHEAPGIVKVGSTYYMFASGKNWWAPTATAYRTSTNLTNWSAWATVPTRPSSADSFATQFEQIIPVTGTSGTSYLFNGDRYSQFAGGSVPAPDGAGRNAWYPLTFAGGVPTLHGATGVNVNAAAGTLQWNPVANGRFDQTGAGPTVPQWPVTGTTDAVKTEATTTSNRNKLTFWKNAAYIASASQTVPLPNGTYKLQFSYRSSGGQNNASLKLKGHGGTDITSDLTTATSTWTTTTVTFTVTTGTVTLLAAADSPASKWMNLDNISIWPN